MTDDSDHTDTGAATTGDSMTGDATTAMATDDAGNAAGDGDATTSDAGALDYSDGAATFGDRLLAARKGAGVRRKTLAHQLGVKVATLRRWEEDRSEPRGHRLTMLSGTLGVSLVWLMTGHGAGPADDAPADADGAAAMQAVQVALLDEIASARTGIAAALDRTTIAERRLRRLLAARRE